MRLSIITAFLLIVHGSIIHASEINIDAQIEMIRQAPQSQRYQLVNELKQQIAQMNANQQARAIAKYQEETLNAQQTMDPNPENIVNQANQQVIKNQIQQEQEHQIIIPTVENAQENINNPIEKVIPEQKHQNPTLQEPANTPTDSMPIDNTPETQPDFSDAKDTFIPEHGDSDNIPDIVDQNPVKDISDDVKEQFPNPIQDGEDNVREKIQQPVQDITDNIKENIPNTDIQQPEVTKDIPKDINPIQKQPINTKPSTPNPSTKRGF